MLVGPISRQINVRLDGGLFAFLAKLDPCEESESQRSIGAIFCQTKQTNGKPGGRLFTFLAKPDLFEGS